tara:strand:- start:52 stop:180 length:129 start_codon:yes stop_codon:yes gene_type:complete
VPFFIIMIYKDFLFSSGMEGHFLPGWRKWFAASGCPAHVLDP